MKRFPAKDFEAVKKVVNQEHIFDKHSVVLAVNKGRADEDFLNADDVLQMLRIISAEKSLIDYPADIVAAAKKIIYSAEESISSREVYDAVLTQVKTNIDETYFYNMLYALSHDKAHKEFIVCSKTVGDRGTVYMWSAKNTGQLDEFMALKISPRERRQYKEKSAPTTAQSSLPVPAPTPTPTVSSAFEKIVSANEQVQRWAVRPDVFIYCDLSSNVASGSQVEKFNSIYCANMVCLAQMTGSGFSITPRPKLLQVVKENVPIHITFHIGAMMRSHNSKVFVFLSKNTEFKTLSDIIVTAGGQSHYVDSFDTLCKLIETDQSIGQTIN